MIIHLICYASMNFYIRSHRYTPNNYSMPVYSGFYDYLLLYSYMLCAEISISTTSYPLPHNHSSRLKLKMTPHVNLLIEDILSEYPITFIYDHL
jgi:hypothetical protein